MEKIRFGIVGIGIGHRLHDDRRISAQTNVPYHAGTRHFFVWHAQDLLHDQTGNFSLGERRQINPFTTREKLDARCESHGHRQRRLARHRLFRARIEAL